MTKAEEIKQLKAEVKQLKDEKLQLIADINKAKSELIAEIQTIMSK